MAQRDARFFRSIFGPSGAIERFYRNPNLNYVVVNRLFLAKKPTLRLIRFILPSYRAYAEDNDLVNRLYLNKNNDLFIRRLINPTTPPVLSDQAINELEAINKLPLTQRVVAQNNLVTKIIAPSTIKAPVKSPTSPVITTPIIASPQLNQIPVEIKAGVVNTLKDFSSNISLPTKGLISRFLTPQTIISGVAGIAGAIVGAGLAGPAGLVGGALVGATAPTTISKGGGQLVLSVGREVGNTVATSLRGFSSLPSPISNRFLVVFILAVFFILPTLIILGGGIQPSATVGATPLPPNLSSCQFYRGDRNPPAEVYKSNVLLQYFKQAEIITSVPAVLLAAIARVESPSVTTKTDTDLSILETTGCPISPTGALGIMQIQPPGTRGYFAAGVEYGASFLNKTPDQLNLCNLAENIIVSGAFILKKLQLGYGIGDGTKWNPQWTTDRNIINKVAEGYYGCLEYGGGDPLKCSGPYNYGQDLWNSLQNCSAISTTLASCPVPGGVIKNPSYQAYLQDPFKGGHCSPSYGTCPMESRRAKAIDIDTQGQNVVFPIIANQTVTWEYVPTELTLTGNDCEGNNPNCGKFYIFKTNLGVDTWVLHLLHIDPNTTTFNRTTGNPSGSIVGKTVPGIYLHLEIGKNIKNINNPPLGSTDLDPGWMSADVELGMCLK